VDAPSLVTAKVRLDGALSTAGAVGVQMSRGDVQMGTTYQIHPRKSESVFCWCFTGPGGHIGQAWW